MTDKNPNSESDTSLDSDRRKFLAACGKFAVVTPPAVTLLLSTSLNSEAIANSNSSSGSGNGNGNGNGNGRGNRNPGDFWNWLEHLLDKFL
jgi:hypothetical protein